MTIGTQIQLGWEMFLEWLRETFGSGIQFPTAPGYVQGYSK